MKNYVIKVCLMCVLILLSIYVWSEISAYTYNFAHDNDSYNQQYFKLVYCIKECPNLKEVVISYDYHSFSNFSNTRNYVYYSYFPKAYRDDYRDDWINVQLVSYKKSVYCYSCSG